MAVWLIKALEKHILELNIVTKFHKIVIKISGHSDRTCSKMVLFHEQRKITQKAWCDMDHHQT